jgi:DNA-binding transcriptional LysR family regulator
MSTSPGRGGLLPAIRSRFSLDHPDATITIRQVGWADPTAGLADRTSDVAFVWLPLPQPSRYRWTVVVEEPCLVAMTDRHRLADRSAVDLDDLLEEPFLALPESAGPLRDFWMAVDHRHGRAPIIGAEITSADETYESLVDGRGICLLASGNAPSVTRGGVIIRPVNGLPPCQLALAWRRDHDHPLVAPYVDCARRVTGRSS